MPHGTSIYISDKRLVRASVRVRQWRLTPYLQARLSCMLFWVFMFQFRVRQQVFIDFMAIICGSGYGWQWQQTKKKSHTEEFKVPKQFRQDEDATSGVQLGFISKNDFPLHIKTPQRESKIKNVRNHRPV